MQEYRNASKPELVLLLKELGHSFALAFSAGTGTRPLLVHDRNPSAFARLHSALLSFYLRMPGIELLSADQSTDRKDSCINPSEPATPNRASST